MKFQIATRSAFWIGIVLTIMLAIMKNNDVIDVSWFAVPYPIFAYALLVNVIFIIEYAAIKTLIAQRENKSA